MELTHAVDHARTTRNSVFATLRRNGRPQLSNVWHHVGDDGLIRVSITATRAKYKNLAREPWGAFHVTTPDFDAYAVIEGDVALTPVCGAPDDPTADALVAHYRTIAGDHPDWAEFRQAQVDQQRVLVALTPTRAYGMLPG